MSRPGVLTLGIVALSCLGAAAQDFTDVAREVGLGEVNGYRTGFADLDGDGWPDVLVLTGKPPDTNRASLRVFFNRPGRKGGRRFVEGTAASGVRASRRPGVRGRVTSLFVTGDVDNDGREDLFTGAYCDLKKPLQKRGRLVRDEHGQPVMTPDHGDRNEILLNHGHGRFVLGPVSDLAAHPDTICAAAFLDVDRDGRLDLFTGAWYEAYGRSLRGYPDRLFRGHGNGSFTDVTRQAGLLNVTRAGTRAGHRPTYGVAHTDWDNDGDQDILVCAYGRQWNLLWRANGDGTFTDVGAATGFDGDMDVFLAEICHWWAGASSDRSSLLVNQGPDHGYAFRRERRGIERRHPGARWNEGDIHAGWLDYDNDGLLDLLLASSDYPDDQFLRLFRQRPDHTFTDVTEASGLRLRNPTQISLADYDRDGDVDILVGATNMRLTKEQRQGRELRLRLFRNEVGNRRHWIALELVGAGPGHANASAIGARATVRTGEVTQLREVYGGQGHAGHQDTKVLHFGLGRHTHADEVRVRWPDRERTVAVLEHVAGDRYHRLVQRP